MSTPTQTTATPTPVTEALRREFATQYLADELGPDWAQDMGWMARESAVRLLSRVGGQQVRQLVALLDEMQRARAHPMNVAIEQQSAFDLLDDDSVWTSYRRLLLAIANEVVANQA